MISCKNHLLYINKINVIITGNEQENPVKKPKKHTGDFQCTSIIIIIFKT